MTRFFHLKQTRFQIFKLQVPSAVLLLLNVRISFIYLATFDETLI